LGCGPKPKLELDKEVEVKPLVSIKVSPSGSVTTANIVRSSGQSKVDRVALDWARSCRFTDSPNGRAGKVRVDVRLE
jgi:TonB family protein